MISDLAPEFSRRRRPASEAFKSVEEVVKETKNVQLRAQLFDSIVLPALTYASETGAIRSWDEHAVSVVQQGVEKKMLGMTKFTQVKEGLQSSELRRLLKIGHAVAWASRRKLGGPAT
ncbi:unnamed protein product [Heligmosomoides polygyrus]|uniref:ApbA_C domain-containing protein n=1 Tax=Heligmosomoides polygyrus TaxID=6339 RepID=A0A183GV37_HELPZ|nr:unnamed protein product [Heligmosomoides polygyrus]